MYVNTGDTIGLIGNTGNAITTPPHLHFGIYVNGEGAIDPYPFIRNIFPVPGNTIINKNYISVWGRIKRNSSTVYRTPGNTSKLAHIKKDTPFIIYGGTGSWYKVKLPDGSVGYLLSSAVEKAEVPVNNLNIDTGDFLEVKNGSATININPSKKEILPVYGSFNDLNLISFNGRYILAKKI